MAEDVVSVPDRPFLRDRALHLLLEYAPRKLSWTPDEALARVRKVGDLLAPALKMKQDDVRTLAGLAAATLAKGDAKAAEDAIAQLEKFDPSSQDLPQFKQRLAGLKK